MTIKEIIDGLKFTVDMFLFDPSTGEAYTEPRNDMDKTTINACKGAIELLEQMPCEDCISRQAVLSYIYNDLGLGDEENGEDLERQIELEDSYRYVKSLPPVTPQPKTERWIPVSERLPEEIGTYMTTVDYGKYGLATGQRYYHGKGLGWEDDCVIAWMPLPEPYKAESEE